MISLLAQGHYQVTASGGSLVGRIDGDHAAGFEARTSDDRRLGPFPTLEEALNALNTDESARQT